MPFTTRVRRALGRPSSTPSSSQTNSTRASSTSSSTTTSQTNLSSTLSSSPTNQDPNLPTITLTKTTSSRLSAKLSSWKRTKGKDAQSYAIPERYAKQQELLGAFEMKFGRRNADGEVDSRSLWSGVSPMASRCCSVELRREEVSAGVGMVEA